MTNRYAEGRFIEPDSCQAGRLTDAQVDAWRNQGATFVRGLFPGELVDELILAAETRYPKPGTQAAKAYTDFGSAGGLTFPALVPSFNRLTLHPNLIGAVAELLGVTAGDIRLSQSDLWPKYHRDAEESAANTHDNSDQRIHVDYPNHTLVHPPPWHQPEAVEMIVYLSDVETTGGSTAVVLRQGDDDPAYPWPVVDSPGIGALRYINNRELAEVYFAENRPERAAFRQRLYERECYTRFKPGDVIFYRHDTWHRGTPMKPGTLRLVQNITYRKAASEWVSTLHTGWSWSAYRDDKMLERLIATASLAQRAVLGFPQPGSHYWCEATLAAVVARYGMFGFDPAPYQAALVQTERASKQS